MKTSPWVLFLASAVLSVGASPVTVEVPLPSACVDTEAVTNIFLNVGGDAVQQFTLSIELDASAYNCVDVAVGCDGNGSGVLEREEVDVLVGWDAGGWVFHDRRVGMFQRVARSDGIRCLRMTVEFRPHKRLKSAKALDDEGTIFSEGIATTVFNGDWNLMRVTSRGAANLRGLVVAEIAGSGFKVRLR